MAKDHDELVKDLHLCRDECYPSLKQAKIMSQLEDFSKQVVATVNEVLAKTQLNLGGAQSRHSPGATGEPASKSVVTIND